MKNIGEKGVNKISESLFFCPSYKKKKTIIYNLYTRNLELRIILQYYYLRPNKRNKKKTKDKKKRKGNRLEKIRYIATNNSF